METPAGHSSGNDAQQDLRRQIDDLGTRLGERDRVLRGLEQLVERQLSMLDRYDRMMSAMPQAHVASGSHDFQRDYDRLVELVDRAVIKAEQLESRNRALEGQLDHALGLLEESVRKQETLAASIPETGRGGAAAAPVYESVEATLAKYDEMLERSLAELERAYRNNQEKDREIEERDRLLSRTLDALENAVEEEGASVSPRQGPLFNRLFC